MKNVCYRFFKTLTVFALIVVFGFSNTASYLFLRVGLPDVADSLREIVPQAHAVAAQGEGIIVYGKSAVAAPQYRIYDPSTNTWGTETAVGGATFSGVPRFIMVKTAPTRDEAVVGVLNDTGTLYIVRWDGGTSSWTQLGSTISLGIGDAKVFDIIYENTSGDAMVVTGGAVDPNYYIWNGSTWSGPTAISQATKTTGTARWIELSARKTSASDELALAYADTNGDLNALIWSGSAWTEQTAVGTALSTGIENNAAATTMRAFDVKYETVSGDLLIIWGNSATVDPRYVTRTAAGVWSAVLTATTFVEIPSIMNMAAEPWGDRIAVGLQNDTTANSNDGDCGIWNGSAWVNTVNCDIARDSQEAGDMVLGSGWVRDAASTTIRALSFYSDAADLQLDYNYWVPGTGWTGTAFTPSPNCIAANSDDNSFVVDHNPFNNAEIMVVRQAGTAICTQKTNYTGAATFNFANAGNGSSLATPSVSQYQPVGFAYFRYIPAPSQTLTIAATAGAKATSTDSGFTSIYANTPSCTSSATCAAFTLSLSSGTDTVTSIKITETGTVAENTDLSNLALFYDTDGNFSNGTTGQYGSTAPNFINGSSTVTGSLAISMGSTYYFYVRYDVRSASTYPKGGQGVDFQIAATSDVGTAGSPTKTGTPTLASAVSTCASATQICVRPNATSTTYGASLSDGARSSESIIITGYGFGVAPNGSQATCTGTTVDIGCVRFLVGGNATVADVDITSWSNTSITLTVSSTLASYGSSSPTMEVVAGGQADATDLPFIVYPNITSVSTCLTCYANSAREYDGAGDTDGLIMIVGDHFQTSGGTVQFTGGFSTLAATVHATVEGPCTVGGWASTTICIEVNNAIGNSTYTGDVTLTRSGDSKTDVFTVITILPQITSNNPTSGIVADIIEINGDHFCQLGTCPVSPNRATSANNVKFGNTTSTDADFVNQTGGAGTCNGAGAAWSHTEICVRVPAGVPSGSQPTKVTSQTNYISNTQAFTVVSSAPNDPTNLQQFKSNGITEIGTGSGTNETTLIIEGDISAGVGINMRLEVEIKPTSTPFDGAISATSSVINGTSIANVTSTATGLSNGTEYHWRARTKNVDTNETSGWVSFGGSDGTRDFYIDTTNPGISPSSCTVHSNVTDTGATISWTVTGETINSASTTNQVRYGLTSSLPNPPTSYDAYPPNGINPTININGLNGGSTYYYWVKSTDAVGNETQNPSGSPFCSFTTDAAVVRIMKTVEYFVIMDQITSAGIASSTFPVFVAEPTSTIRTAYIEVTGVLIGTGGSEPTIAVGVNNQASSTYYLPNLTTPQPFTIRYTLPSTTLQVSTCTTPVENQNSLCGNGTDFNKLFLTFGGGFGGDGSPGSSKASLVSGKIVITYYHTL